MQARLGHTLLVLAASGAVMGCDPGPGMPDTGMGMDVRVPVSCTGDDDCPDSYCNDGTDLCCVPAVPAYEICGDRIDQNCDRRDCSIGDNDMDGIQACIAGEDPLGGCDCDDELATVRPPRGLVAGAPELCDGIDNDCNNRIDEASECCPACDALGAERTLLADACAETGECDCSGEEGVGVCAAGTRCCADGCVDLQNDVTNCGVCGAACTVGSDRCTAGACSCGERSPCDFTDVCTDGVCGPA